jgi:site-specific DNA-adenine methylase
MLFGIPYMGSKTKIAPALLRHLPNGERFVDLFGGGSL